MIPPPPVLSPCSHADHRSHLDISLPRGVPLANPTNTNTKGFDSTCGMAARCFKPAEGDALAVELLRAAGAVPFVRTNVPQLLLMAETDNHVWGRCDNPWASSRTCGGSSGGEAALVALRGSPLGLGTDVGGSVRSPAFYCGVVGFKPTPSRVSRLGVAVPRQNERSGQLHIPSAAGPIGKTVDDVALLAKAVWEQPAHVHADPTVPPLRFDEPLYLGPTGPAVLAGCPSAFDPTLTPLLPLHHPLSQGGASATARCGASAKRRGLRVGVLGTDGWFTPCAANTRALEEAAALLAKVNTRFIAVAATTTSTSSSSMQQ